jgi:phospholipid transport system substrate-binding protein
MNSRRQLLRAAALLPFAAAYARSARAASAQAATALVTRTVSQLLAIVNGKLPDAEKRQRLSQLIDATVDVPGVARFCLGRFWRMATAQQQKDYVTLFHGVLVSSFSGKLGEYRGVSIQLGDTTIRDDGVHVASVVNQPNNPPAHVDWVVDISGPQPRIIDLVAEGTSLRLTQRSDYASFITRHGNSLDALLTAMREQLARQG